eukprot:1641175-Amphidinium_carterae.2
MWAQLLEFHRPRRGVPARLFYSPGLSRYRNLKEGSCGVTVIEVPSHRQQFCPSLSKLRSMLQEELGFQFLSDPLIRLASQLQRLCHVVGWSVSRATHAPLGVWRSLLSQAALSDSIRVAGEKRAS